MLFTESSPPEPAEPSAAWDVNGAMVAIRTRQVIAKRTVVFFIFLISLSINMKCYGWPNLGENNIKYRAKQYANNAIFK